MGVVCGRGTSDSSLSISSDGALTDLEDRSLIRPFYVVMLNG